MYKRSCPTCHQPSFNSCDFGTWICPKCHTDLTTAKLYDAETGKERKPQLFLIKKKYLQENPKLNASIKPYIFRSFD